MHRLMSAATVIAIIAALFGAGPRQALACSCSGIQPDETYVRELLDFSDLMVVGTVVSYNGLIQAPTPLSETSPGPKRD